MFPLLKRIELEFPVGYNTGENEKWLINENNVESVCLMSRVER